MITTSQAPVAAPLQDLWAAVHHGARALARRVIEALSDAHPVASTVSLKQGATTWLVKPLGRRVTCESGLLWLCFDAEPLDIVLQPGETHLCAKRSAMSIHALSRSVARLD